MIILNILVVLGFDKRTFKNLFYEMRTNFRLGMIFLVDCGF